MSTERWFGPEYRAAWRRAYERDREGLMQSLVNQQREREASWAAVKKGEVGLLFPTKDQLMAKWND